MFLALVLSLGVSAQAQSNCNQSVNPHSMACTDETFFGNHFPVVDISEDRVRGTWKLLTVTTEDGALSEFKMIQNQHNPRIPESVLNRSDRSPAGPMVWRGSQVQIQNWKKNRVDIDSGSSKFRDQWTLQTQLEGGVSLQCRIFVRNNTDHLLCLWFEKKKAGFVKRGYLGFLKN